MEVKNLSQGRQAAFDTTSLSSKSIDAAVQKVPSLNEESVKNEKSSNKPTEKDVKNSVEKLNKLLEGKNSHVEYEIYGKHKDITIKIIDDVTKKVIKEIPPKKIIDMVNKLCELAGILVDEKA